MCQSPEAEGGTCRADRCSLRGQTRRGGRRAPRRERRCGGSVSPHGGALGGFQGGLIKEPLNFWKSKQGPYLLPLLALVGQEDRLPPPRLRSAEPWTRGHVPQRLRWLVLSFLTGVQQPRSCGRRLSPPYLARRPSMPAPPPRSSLPGCLGGPRQDDAVRAHRPAGTPVAPEGASRGPRSGQGQGAQAVPAARIQGRWEAPALCFGRASVAQDFLLF